MSSTTLHRPTAPAAAPVHRLPAVAGPAPAPARTRAERVREERLRSGARTGGRRAAVHPGAHPCTPATPSPGAVQGLLPAALGRVLGMIVTAAAVTAGLVSEAMTAGTLTLAQVAGSSIGGVATSAVLSSVWAYQDRRAVGVPVALQVWGGVAFGVGLAHGVWLALVVPGPATGDVAARLGTVALTVALDTLLVALPALLGVRAAAPATDGTSSPIA